MRQRLLRRRERSMARRAAGGGRIDLSPRARMIGGWLVALLLVLGVAGAVRFFGESSEGALGGPDGSAAPGATPGAIVFGTLLTPERQVPLDARATSFSRGDTFAYAVEEAAPARRVYVEVGRTGGGAVETVQEPVEAQRIPDAPGPIAFSVPAAALLDAWGPGTYLMRIRLAAGGPVIAEGQFTLAEASQSP
jgi:hypothetical protein